MMTTDWQTILVGVDASSQAVQAARFAIALADRAQVPVHLVHATAGGSATAAAVAGALRTHIPDPVLERLDVRRGRPGRVLAEVARELPAGLVVVGGKRHGTLGRWMAGSTAHAAVRMAPVPVLITAGEQLPHRRVLCAVDLSVAAAPTLRVAERWARLLGAQLTVLHAIEPLPLLAEVPFSVSPGERRAAVEEDLARMVWPFADPAAERLVRAGDPERIIADEVHRRHADLVVVGSHGRGWVDRVVLGSVTERLLGNLGAPLVVVPVEIGVAAAS